MLARLTRPVLVALIAAAAGALLAACGDDDGATTVTVTETQTVTDTPTAPSQPPPADGQPPPADSEVDELTGFSSPTGNIGCYIEPIEVRCDIAERAWSPPPAPPRCELDFGQGIALTAGARARFVCAGDTTLGPERKLDYGTSIAAGLLRCESSELGIRCEDTETGRGFLLARQRYELF